MSAAEIIYTLLTFSSDVTDLVGLRIYPMVAPQGIARPFITYRRVSAPRVGRHFAGATGIVEPRYEINIWADDAATVEAVGVVAHAALGPFSGFDDVELLTERDGYDDTTGYHRLAQDYRITHEE
jgi:hypothetical protein